MPPTLCGSRDVPLRPGYDHEAHSMDSCQIANDFSSGKNMFTRAAVARTYTSLHSTYSRLFDLLATILHPSLTLSMYCGTLGIALHYCTLYMYIVCLCFTCSSAHLMITLTALQYMIVRRSITTSPLSNG